MKTNNIQESSLQRVYQHLNTPGRTVLVISAYVKDPELLAKVSGLKTTLSKEEQDKINLQRHKNLREELEKDKIGYIEFDSGYEYTGEKEVTPEKSYMVMNLNREQALALGQKYNQQSILWKDNHGFFLLGCEKGDEWMQFNTTKVEMIMGEEVFNKAFSALIKANSSQKGVKFHYLAQKEIPSTQESLIDLDMGRIPKIRIKKIKLTKF